jgi:hypothetical protein
VGPIQEVGRDGEGLSLLNPRLLDLKSTEQSENVYENKGPVEKSTTPDPALSKEGNCCAPLLVQEGNCRAPLLG